MIPDEKSIQSLIGECLGQLREDLSLPVLNEFNNETILLGAGSDLDSMAIVHLISDLEGRLFEVFNLTWILADERALSRTRSPFRTVGNLTSFIIETTP